MNFDLTSDARVDLRDIAISIARDNPERATTYIAELIDYTAQVAAQPGLYRLRPEWGDEVRSARFGNYLILFELRAERVAILRYLHGRRDIGAIMSKETQ